MAEFKRVRRVWTPYADMRVSACEVDALRNLLNGWMRSGKPFELGQNHVEALVELHNQMNVAGGPVKD